MVHWTLSLNQNAFFFFACKQLQDLLSIQALLTPLGVLSIRCGGNKSIVSSKVGSVHTSYSHIYVFGPHLQSVFAQIT